MSKDEWASKHWSLIKSSETVHEGDQDITEDNLDENLRDWFGKEKWVRMDTKGNIKGACARGSESEGKPKCLPQAKAHALGKKGRASAAQKKRREDPNPERRGAAINVATRVKEDELDEACWKGYHKDGMKTMFGKRYPNCIKNKNESLEVYVNRGECPGCGGAMVSEDQINEKQDACYHKVKSRYKVWPSAYASGALVQCRKKGASDWGNKTEDVTDKELDEVSKDTLGRYLKLAGVDVANRASASSYKSGASGDTYNKADPGRQEVSRERGIDRAITKLTK
jgi:hypothetical protein